MLVAIFMFGVSGEIACVLWMPFRVKLALSVTVTALSTCDLSGLPFDNCSITQRAEKKKVSCGSRCIIDVGPFLLAALSALVCQEQDRHSLSLVPWKQARVESCSKMYFPSKVKSRSHIWSSLRVISPQPRLRTASPLHHFAGGDRQAGAARALGRSEVTATRAVQRGIFLQRRHGTSGGAVSCACESAF